MTHNVLLQVGGCYKKGDVTIQPYNTLQEGMLKRTLVAILLRSVFMQRSLYCTQFTVLYNVPFLRYSSSVLKKRIFVEYLTFRFAFISQNDLHITAKYDHF